MASAGINFEDIANLDSSIEVLLQCKPLAESQIKVLCDKVSDMLDFASVSFMQIVFALCFVSPWQLVAKRDKI